MKINIYYGGRGLVGDPTLYVLSQMETVFKELNVEVGRYNLYEQKNAITTLPQTLKEADGIILATTIEWFGLGGYMQQFLDSCWLYGDKEVISSLYMCPVVMSTTYGEKEGKLSLSNAWEILGGLPCSGICGYVTDTISLEMNSGIQKMIEKKAENMYRTIKQRPAVFPSSNQAVKQRVSLNKNISLTPQETEQLSMYVADDNYVQTQKEDILELTSLFKEKLGKGDNKDAESYIKAFKDHFKPQTDFRCSFCFRIEGKGKPLILQINNGQMKCFFGDKNDEEVDIQVKSSVMDDITQGRMTFQKAFMTGEMIVKGEFKNLRSLDLIFGFMED